MINHLSLVAICACLILAGCGKSGSTSPSGMPTQGTAPPQTENYPGIDLTQMTIDLKRWIIQTKERPGSFEDYAAKAKITAPPAPAGKKFAISKEMRIVLVDR